VTTENRGIPAKADQFLLGKEALICKQYVQRDATVALAQDEAVTFDHSWLLGVECHDFVKENPQDFDE
jgi:hypothetical protein